MVTLLARISTPLAKSQESYVPETVIGVAQACRLTPGGTPVLLAFGQPVTTTGAGVGVGVTGVGVGAGLVTAGDAVGVLGFDAGFVVFFGVSTAVGFGLVVTLFGIFGVLGTDVGNIFEVTAVVGLRAGDGAPP